MQSKIIKVSFVTIALGCIVFFIICITQTSAKQQNFNNQKLFGDYASQLTGTINYPEGFPGSDLNGPYALTGRVTADGKGNAWGTVYENYNGMLFNVSWEGTYDVYPDGTVSLVAEYEFNGMPAQIEMFGVLCDEGKQMRLIHVAPTLPDPMPPNMLGTIITGSWTKQ